MEKDKFLKKSKSIKDQIQEYYQAIDILTGEQNQHIKSCTHPENHRKRDGLANDQSQCGICNAVITIRWIT